jgi:hypothetical protein
MAADARCDPGAGPEDPLRRERDRSGSLEQCGSSIRRGVLKGKRRQKIRHAEMA